MRLSEFSIFSRIWKQLIPRHVQSNGCIFAWLYFKTNFFNNWKVFIRVFIHQQIGHSVKIDPVYARILDSVIYRNVLIPAASIVKTRLEYSKHLGVVGSTRFIVDSISTIYDTFKIVKNQSLGVGRFACDNSTHKLAGIVPF